MGTPDPETGTCHPDPPPEPFPPMTSGPVDPERQEPERLGAYARESELRLAALGLQVQHLGDEFGDSIQEVFTDNGVPGDTPWTARRGLSRAIYAITNKEIEGIAACSLERLARGVLEQETILSQVWRWGGRVVTIREGEILPDIGGSEERTYIRRQLAFAAEQELMAMRERRRRGQRRAAAAGRYTGGNVFHGRKYGYRLVIIEDPRSGPKRVWEPIPEEMEIVWEIHDRLGGKNRGYSAMARELDARGVPTIGGGPWLRRLVKKIALRKEPVSRTPSVLALPQKRTETIAEPRRLREAG